MRATVAWVLASATALSCGGTQRAPLSHAGDDRDDGAGQLAQASLRLATPSPDDASDDDSFREDRRVTAATTYSMYGGDPYGGAAYGGTSYGGATYAGWIVPQWNYSPPIRLPKYNVIGGLRGSIEGTVTWAGAPPTRLTTSCGLIDNPTLHIGADKGIRGAVVFIEKVAVGRAIPYYARPASVGGVVAKRGCTLVPAVQIVAPLPSALSIHGDEQPTRLELTGEKSAPTRHELQEAGLVQVEAKAGVTRIDTERNKVTPAWVLGLDTPYYAITDDTGHYRIDELAPGTYEVTFWQPPVATIGANGAFTVGAPIIAKRTITVGAQPAKLSVALGR
jgi:hypothetical protein